MRDPLEGYAVRQHVKPRTEQESDVFRRAVSAAMRQGTAPGEPKPTVVVPHRMTAHPVPRPEVPLILNGVAVTARKPDQAAWNWLLGAITHADSEAERTLRCMDLLAYTLDPDDMRRWQASGVHSGAEIKTAAGVVIRALRHDGEREVRELHDAAGRTVQHEVRYGNGRVVRCENEMDAREMAACIPGAVRRERLVDWGKNEPADAPVERRAWPIIALLAAVFMLASGGLAPTVNALPVPDWAKAVVWISALLVLTAATMRGVYLTLRWADQKPQAIEPPRSTEPASAEPEREPAFVLDSGTFTPVSDCPACRERAVHALDVAYTGEGIGRVCECGYRWTQTVLNLAGQ